MSGGFFRKNLIIGGAEILCRLPLIFTLGYLARSVGPNVYGTWTLLLVVQNLAANLGSMGLSSSLSRFSPAAEPARAHAYIRLAMMVGGMAMAGILSLGILLHAPLGSLLGIPPDFRWLMPVALLMAAGSVADGYLDAYFKAREKVPQQVGYLLTRTAAEIMAVAGVFTTGLFADAGKALAAYVTVVLAVKLAVYPILLRQRGPAYVALPQDEKSAFLQYGYAMLPSLLVVWLTSQADRLVLGRLVSPSELGVYGFSATLASYLVFLGYAAMALFLPRASRLYDERRRQELQRLFAHSQIVYLGIMTAAMVLVALFAREILLLTAGAPFTTAPMILIVLCLAVCMDQLLGIHQYVFHLVKKPQWVFRVNLLQGTLIALLVSFFTLAGGFPWAPWGVLTAVALTNLTRYRLAMRMLYLPMPTVVLIGLPLLLAMTCALTLLSIRLSLENRAWVAICLLSSIGVVALRWREQLSRITHDV